MSHRLSQLFDSLQSKLGGTAQTHGGPPSLGGHSANTQTPGMANLYSPSPQYGTPRPQSQGAHTYYGDPIISPPPYGAQNHNASPYAPSNPHTAPASYSPPPQAPYGQQAPYTAPASYGYGPAAPPAPHGVSYFYPPQAQNQPLQAPPPGPAPLPTRVSVRPGDLASNTVDIQAANAPNAPPLYTFLTSYSKPQIVMIDPQTHTEIGHASISSLSSTVRVSHRGQAMTIKQSGLGDKFTLEAPGGTLRWKVDNLSGKLKKLVDGEGGLVATFRSGGFPGGEKVVELCGPVDLQMFELIVLSMMVARTINSENNKAVLEAVMGA